jgi:hypothetical protein
MWGNSLDISKGFFKAGMCEFESSEVSQAFRVLENFLFRVRKPRQMRAFLIVDSLKRPTSALFGPRIPKSLQPNPRKLPFSRDSPWRPKNISTACWTWQCAFASMLTSAHVIHCRLRRSASHGHQNTSTAGNSSVADTIFESTATTASVDFIMADTTDIARVVAGTISLKCKPPAGGPAGGRPRG